MVKISGITVRTETWISGIPIEPTTAQPPEEEPTLDAPTAAPPEPSQGSPPGLPVPPTQAPIPPVPLQSPGEEEIGEQPGDDVEVQEIVATPVEETPPTTVVTLDPVEEIAPAQAPEETEDAPDTRRSWRIAFKTTVGPSK